MGMENKTNFIVAVRGYTIVKKETKTNCMTFLQRTL